MFSACDGNSTVPAAPTNETPSVTTPAPHDSGYEISDVRLVTVRDPVVFWRVSFDARWTDTGAPQEARCRWRMFGDDGVAIISGGIRVKELSVNDEIASSVYPDEIPGVPRTAAIDCS